MCPLHGPASGGSLPSKQARVEHPSSENRKSEMLQNRKLFEAPTLERIAHWSVSEFRLPDKEGKCDANTPLLHSKCNANVPLLVPSISDRGHSTNWALTVIQALCHMPPADRMVLTVQKLCNRLESGTG